MKDLKFDETFKKFFIIGSRLLLDIKIFVFGYRYRAELLFFTPLALWLFFCSPAHAGDLNNFTNTFESYPDQTLITDVSNWYRYAGEALGKINQRPANKVLEFYASSSDVYTFYNSNTNTATGSICLDYFAENGTTNQIRLKKDGTDPIWAFQTKFITDINGNSEVKYIISSSTYPDFVSTGFSFQSNATPLRVCYKWDCDNDVFFMKVNHYTILYNQQTYNNCAAVGRFEINGYNPNHNSFIDNLTNDNTIIYSNFTEATTTIFNLPDFGGTVIIGSESDIAATEYTKCLINETCLLTFNYGYATIGLHVNLVPDIEGERDLEHIIQTRDLISGAVLWDYFDVPDRFAPVVDSYCIYLESVDALHDKIFCGLLVEWVADNWEIDLDYDINSACDNMASSSGSYWDDFRYGIECGARKVMYWAFNPTATSTKSFYLNINKLQNAFPFNIYFTVTNTIKAAIATTTMTSSDTFGVPMVSATSSDFYIMPVLSSSSLPNMIGQANSDLFRNTIGYFFWIGTGFLIFFSI